MRLHTTSAVRTTVIASVLTTLLALTAGCAGGAVPDVPPDVTGPALQVDHAADGGPTRLLVEEYEGDQLVTAAYVTIDDETTVLIETGGETVEGSATDVAIDALVSIWFEGPVAESWPLQATAGTVLVLE